MHSINSRLEVQSRGAIKALFSLPVLKFTSWVGPISWMYFEETKDNKDNIWSEFICRSTCVVSLLKQTKNTIQHHRGRWFQLCGCQKRWLDVSMRARYFPGLNIFQAWIPRYDDGIISTGFFWCPHNEHKHVKKFTTCFPRKEPRSSTKPAFKCANKLTVVCFNQNGIKRGTRENCISMFYWNFQEHDVDVVN